MTPKQTAKIYQIKSEMLTKKPHWSHQFVARGRVFQIFRLLSCAGGLLDQHYYAIATVIIYESQWGALLNVRTKGLREFKQGLVSYKEEDKKTLNL